MPSGRTIADVGMRGALLSVPAVSKWVAHNKRVSRAGGKTVPIEVVVKLAPSEKKSDKLKGTSEDKKRVALHKGWRISKSGNLYEEYRTNRTDRRKYQGK